MIYHMDILQVSDHTNGERELRVVGDRAAMTALARVVDGLAHGKTLPQIAQTDKDLTIGYALRREDDCRYVKGDEHGIFYLDEDIELAKIYIAPEHALRAVQDNAVANANQGGRPNRYRIVRITREARHLAEYVA